MTRILRKGASNGLWCPILLPFSLLPYAVKYAGAYRIFCAISFWLAIPFFINEKLFRYKQSFTSHLLFYSLLSIPATIITSWFSSYSFTSLYAINYTAIVLFDWLTSTLLKHCPGSFTIGEAQILSQGVTLFVLNCGLTILNEFEFSTTVFEDRLILNSAKFLQILILGCLSMMYVFHTIPYLAVGYIAYVPALIAAAVMLMAWSVYLDHNPVLWLSSFCFQDTKRIFLLSFWFASTFASIVFVMMQNQTIKENITSSTRKYFHFVVIAVFIPGIILDPEFLNLATGVALAVFMALETCRILKIPPIGPVIHNAFQVFLDEKDSGILILTHAYLLIGCSSPLWIYSYHFKNEGYHICLLSGVFSVGFGDTAAALGGSMIGKHKWKGSVKTLEGTACAVVAQLIFSIPFLYMNHEFSMSNICLTTTAVLFTSILEAKTTQVDNLVLPLFMFSFLSWIP